MSVAPPSYWGPECSFTTPIRNPCARGKSWLTRGIRRSESTTAAAVGAHRCYDCHRSRLSDTFWISYDQCACDAKWLLITRWSPVAPRGVGLLRGHLKDIVAYLCHTRRRTGNPASQLRAVQDPKANQGTNDSTPPQKRPGVILGLC